MKRVSKCPHCGAPIYEKSKAPLEIEFSCECRHLAMLPYVPYVPPPIVIERPIPPWRMPHPWQYDPYQWGTISVGDTQIGSSGTARYDGSLS